MKLIPQSPKKALKAFLKQTPLESERDKFKTNFIALLDKISLLEKMPKEESEEHLKNDVRDFLRDTFYLETNAINTKGKEDLVIWLDKTTDSDVGVIIEAKRPSNTGEMLTADYPNKKALHELILYYLNERKSGNFKLKNLVATNIYEWFIIDANYFDAHIYNNHKIRELHDTKGNDKKTTPFFYEEVAKIIDKIAAQIPCVYFDIRDYESILRNHTKENDKELIALYKILSPEHLLKIATPNDGNALNEKFYKELLHIIGLEEAREGSKNIIRRKSENRNTGSLIELTIDALISEDVLHHVPDAQNQPHSDKAFNTAFELCITWINRILFLKLLEGQLITYYNDKEAYRFINSKTINSFAELFKLFHNVLAKNIKDRPEPIKTKYSRVPYLNSSLFEISDLEDQTIKVNSLVSNEELDLISTTILWDVKKEKDRLPTLDYLFRFLNAYDFATEGVEAWRKDNKPLISASVLGKVFEKINGYKNGSVFTPAFITMYMCRQSIRLAVIDKFNGALGKDGEKLFDKFDDVKNYTSRLVKTQDIQKANEIINSLRICDPAVGSGHFLVSALNEIIVIKSELGILADEQWVSFNGYEFEVINDELIITDQSANIIAYKMQNGRPVSKEIQRLQKSLFHEKQIIIENCLFGVDIEQKSVLICRLRLWVELLKNAYYISPEYIELETLPNIDINIKTGNSLMSRFAIDDRNNILPKDRPVIKQLIERYKLLVDGYKNAPDKKAKDDYRRQIDYIKIELQKFIFIRDKDYIQLKKKEAELLQKQSEINFSGEEERKIWSEQINIMAQEAFELRTAYEHKMKSLYSNALEWRFEFPEILDKEGIFEGFDVIIGNPPYIKEYDKREVFDGLRDKECYQGKMDIWYLFGDLGLKLLKPDSYLCFIATNNWVTNAGASNFRNIVIEKSKIENLTDFGAYMIFDSASIQTMIMLFKNNSEEDNYTFDYRCLDGKNITRENVLNLLQKVPSENSLLLSPVINKKQYKNKSLLFNSGENETILKKIKARQNFSLREKADRQNHLKSEVGQGIVAPQYFVNNDSAERLGGKTKVGEGIFVLSEAEFQQNGFSAKEKEIIKPYYTTEQLHKYYGSNKNTHWLIYTKSDIDLPDAVTKKMPIDNYPKIKAHLDRFKDVITSDYAPYGLHRSREQHLFEGQKIVVLRKCPNEPIFTYTDFDCFVSQTFFVIQSDRINLKYLTGLLNSKLIEFWLRRRGKMQGNNYQLDKAPLLEIPIYKPSDKEAALVAALVDDIIAERAGGGQTSNDKEKMLNKIIYSLYNITLEEQQTIES